MNNAGVGNNPGKPWENRDAWKRLLDINFWGVVHGVEAFAPRMLAAGKPGLIVNTGSKQGITTPPGNLAYNVSKAALKTFTEGLAHALRNEPGAKSRASAHSGIHLYWPDRRGDGKAGRRLDRRAGRRLHAGFAAARRFLHSVSRQRGRAAHGRKTHGLGDRRHHREPPCSVALAPGPQGRFRGYPHGRR